MSRWIRLAFKEAKKGRHRQHKVGAVVIRGGKVVSKAYNISRPFGIDNCGFHAEERALREDRNFKGSTIIVVRSNLNFNIAGLSKPCDKCMKVIRAKGVKKICYLDDNKVFITERV